VILYGALWEIDRVPAAGPSTVMTRARICRAARMPPLAARQFIPGF